MVTALSARFRSKFASSRESPASAKANRTASAEYNSQASSSIKKLPVDFDILSPVWKSKFYGAFVLNHHVVLHAIDATPARWRGDDTGKRRSSRWIGKNESPRAPDCITAPVAKTRTSACCSSSDFRVAGGQHVSKKLWWYAGK